MLLLLSTLILPLLPCIYVLVTYPLTPKLHLLLPPLLLSFVLSFVLSILLIPRIKHYPLKAGLFGKDLGKRGTKNENVKVPESLGLVSGVVFLTILLLLLIPFSKFLPERLPDLNSSLISITFMVLLGFTDDVLDWPWRYKVLLPTLATLPLLVAYDGPTSILIPGFLRSFLMSENQLTTIGELVTHIPTVVVDTEAAGAIVNLGLLYLVYMSFLSVFTTNCINIYAGINGLEAGQSYVIGCFVLLHNLLEISNNSLSTPHHFFSAVIILPFLGVTAGLLKFNWYPSSVFVGDTYCYFAGMTLACVGIHGHFSKTLLLFFLPQIANFLWSVPQIFKFVPCPRHRLPRFDSKRGVMLPSNFDCGKGEYRLLKWRSHHEDGKDGPGVNMTVINLTLQLLGPMGEEQLTVILLLLQFACCSLGLLLRYNVGSIFVEE